MTGIERSTSTAPAAPLAALVITLCAGIAYATNADAANASDKTELLALEKSANEAWKSKDANFWGAFLWDKFVGWGPSGRLDKASATKLYTGADCDIRSVALSEEEVQPLGDNAALVTQKTAVEGTCNGRPVPALDWAAS